MRFWVVLTETDGVVRPVAQIKLDDQAARNSERLVLEKSTTLLRSVLAGISNDDDAALIYRELSLLLAAAGDASGALDAIQNAFRRAPDALAIVREYRKASVRSKDALKTVAALEAEARILSSGPSAAALHLERARILEHELDQRKAAQLALRTARDHDPSDVAVLLALADVAQHERDHESAAKWLESLSDTATDPVLAGELRGRFVLYLESTGDVSGAFMHAVSARVHAPSSVTIQYALERLYSARAEDGELCDLRESQITAGSVDARLAWFDVGVVAKYRLHDHALAKQAFERACEASGWKDIAPLDELAPLVERAEDWPRWLELLDKRIGLETDANARAHLWFRVARVIETRLQDTDRAIATYQKALAENGAYVPALEGAGRLLSLSGGNDQLIEMHRLEAKTATTAEERTSAELRAARILVQSPATIEDGIALLAGILETLPSDPTVLETIAGAYTRTKRWEQLIGIHERQLVSASPTRRSSLLINIAAVAAERLGDRKRAISALERIDALDDSGPPLALVRLATLLEEEGEWEKLAGVLEKVLAYVSDPAQLASLLERLGAIHEQLGDSERALELYGQAAHAAPPGHPALATAGRAYLRAERYDDLAALFERAASEGSPQRRAFWRTKRAHVLAYDLDRVDDAIAALRDALEADKTYEHARRSLGELLEREERYEDLAALIEPIQGTDASSRGTRALRLAVLAEARHDDDDRAAQLYHEAIEHGVDLARLPYLRLRGSSQAEQAESIYANTSGSPTIVLHARYRAGELAARRHGGRADAIGHFEEALRIAPNDLAVSLALLPLLRDKPERLDSLLSSISNEINDPAIQTALQLRRTELAATTAPDRALAMRRRALETAPLHPVSSVIVELALEQAADRTSLAKLLRAQCADSMLDPDLQSATYCALGTVLEELGHVRDATDAFETARHASLSMPPWSALLALPRLYAAQRNHEGLTNALRELADRLPVGGERATCLRFLAGVLSEAGDTGAAVDALEDALAGQPEHYPALRDLEQLCKELGDPDRFLDSLTRCFETADPDEAVVALGTTLAARLIRDDRYESAVDVLDRVLATRPDDLNALMLRAEVDERRETWDLAARSLEQVLDHPNTEPLVRAEALARLAGIVDEEINDPDHLARVAARVDAIESTDLPFLRVAANVYKRVGDHPKTATSFERLIESPGLSAADRAEYLIRLAALQDRELHDPAGAIETLARVNDAARQADAIGLLLELGERSNRWDLACDALQTALGRAVQMDASWELAIRRRLAGLLEGPLDRLDDASAQYARIAELDTSDVQSLERLAVIDESRNPARALDVHRSLLELDPSRISSYRKMRSLFLATSNDDGAFCAEAALVGLGAADEEEVYFHRQRLATLKEGNNAPLDDNELSALCPERKDVALELLGHIEPLLQQVFPTDLAGQGVDLQSTSTSQDLRAVASAVAQMFGNPNHVVVVTPDRIGPTVELTDKLILLIPRSVEGETRRFQRLVFGALFGRARFHGIATDQRRLNPLSPRHLEHVLWATCSLVRDDVNVPDQGAIYKDIRRRVATALTPEIRAAVRAVVDRVVATPAAINGDRLSQIAAAAATRSGLASALDPAEGILALQKLDTALGFDPDQIPFVTSKQHLELRQRRGWGVKQ